MFYDIYKDKNYTIILVGDEEGISHLYFNSENYEPRLSPTYQQSEYFFKEAKKQIKEFFYGERTKFNLKLNPKGTEFQKKVWKELLKIPYGELRTYKDIAIKIGNPNASRAIGMANNRNPIPLIIPCHRVVGANNKLVGYAYGIDMKKKLINLEKMPLIITD